MTDIARTALVTGAGRNIGRAIALRLASDGHRVVCAYANDEAAAAGVANEIADAGGNARTALVDIADVEQTREAVGDLVADGWGIEILVNNAAIRPRTPLEKVTVEEWDAVLATNLRGAFFLAQAAVAHMISQGWGRIVNISGIDAFHGSLQRPHVVASKLGLVGLGRALANELALNGITVNTVVPGVLATERYHHGSDDIDKVMAAATEVVPMGRLGTADDVAGAVAYFASESSSYITGQELMVSGGAYPLVRHRHREKKKEANSPC